MKRSRLPLFVCFAVVLSVALVLLYQRGASPVPVGEPHPAAEARRSTSPGSMPLESEDSPGLDRYALSKGASEVQADNAPGAGEPEVPAEEQLWRERYGTLSYRRLESSQGQLLARLTELAAPAFDEYVMRGDYEVVGVGQSYVPEKWDNEPLTQVRVPHSGSADQRILKVTLKEADYPELYSMQHEKLWIDRRLEELLSMPPSSPPR